MAVITAPYWHGTPVRLPTLKLWCKTINIDICCEGYHKILRLGSSRKQAHWQGLGLHTKTPKMKWRAAKGGGFEGSTDSVNDEDNDVDKEDDDEEEEEEEKNMSFWEKKETKQKMKELEEMSDLIKEAEKLQEGDVQAHEEGEATKEEEESEEDKRKKLREELAKRAREQAEKRETAEIMFQMGQRAYGKGMYNKAVDLLEGALSNVPKVSLVGGEIQLWLAMAYEAHNRHDDCIALYKSLEKTHPIRAVRQKAADLRYILEAPKLKITEEERVSIPLIDYDSNYDSSKRSWSQMYRNRRKAAVNKGTPPMRDYYQDFLVWKRPKWERSPLFWVVVAGWLTLVGVALVFQD